MKLNFSPKAKADIENITQYIALDKPSAAENWLEELISKCSNLTHFPEIGISHFEVRKNMRILPFGKYLILYHFNKTDVEIVRVFHGAQEWQNHI